MPNPIPLLRSSLEISRALATSRSVERAAPAILRALCTALGWEVGILWVVDSGAGRLRYVRSWSREASRARTFARASVGVRFRRGEGLPGRVWKSGRPAWIADISRDPNFPRVPLASTTGLHSGFAIPIRVHGRVHGVVEFLSRAPRPLHPRLLQVLAGVGAQIGHFAARCEIEKELAERNRQLRSANSRLRKLASTDALTGLFNRRTFLARLARSLEGVGRGCEFSLAIVDIDHFKRVNDRFGHEAGDRVLKRIAVTLRRSVRKVDTVARYGGEEFGILFSGVGLPRAAALAESLRKRVRRLSGPWAPVTVSVGLAACRRAEGGPDELIRLADEALYKAKASGRNRLVVAPGR